MGELQKITEGMSGQEVANLIYQNDIIACNAGLKGKADADLSNVSDEDIVKKLYGPDYDSSAEFFRQFITTVPNGLRVIDVSEIDNAKETCCYLVTEYANGMHTSYFMIVSRADSYITGALTYIQTRYAMSGDTEQRSKRGSGSWSDWVNVTEDKYLVKDDVVPCDFKVVLGKNMITAGLTRYNIVGSGNIVTAEGCKIYGSNNVINHADCTIIGSGITTHAPNATYRKYRYNTVVEMPFFNIINVGEVSSLPFVICPPVMGQFTSVSIEGVIVEIDMDNNVGRQCTFKQVISYNNTSVVAYNSLPDDTILTFAYSNETGLTVKGLITSGYECALNISITY